MEWDTSPGRPRYVECVSEGVGGLVPEALSEQGRATYCKRCFFFFFIFPFFFLVITRLTAKKKLQDFTETVGHRLGALEGGGPSGEDRHHIMR